MSEELREEQEAINAIYGEGTFEASDTGSKYYVLAVPGGDTTFRLFFPPNYPGKPPQILGTVTIGGETRKGYGTNALTQARETLRRIFSPGVVCIFDLLQELEIGAGNKPLSPHLGQGPLPTKDTASDREYVVPQPHDPRRGPKSCAFEPHNWIVSRPVTVKKSVFIARACPVSTPSQAETAVAQLLINDKRISKATHNITAHRIRLMTTSHGDDNSKEIVYQDCNDDGETAAGGRLLHLMQVMDVWNLCVVVSRYYGGVRLGPDRFKIISQAAREVIVEGGWLKGRGPESTLHVTSKFIGKNQIE